ncbi:MAG: ribosome-associated translation inhibitor RaiA [bacterium]|nr:ribosome-associated translation inhibitor RaiA [bacterium]
MQVSVTAKKLELTPNIRTYTEDKLGKLDKYLDGLREAHILLRVEKHRHIAEVTVRGKHADFTGKEDNEDLYAAIDRLVDKIERQIRKYKTKNLNRRRRKTPAPVDEEMFDMGSITIFGSADVTEDTDYSHPVIEEKFIHLDSLRPEQAISRMEVHGNDFWVYTDAEYGQMSVVYRRKDGTYGMIQPRD